MEVGSKRYFTNFVVLLGKVKVVYYFMIFQMQID